MDLLIKNFFFLITKKKNTFPNPTRILDEHYQVYYVLLGILQAHLKKTFLHTEYLLEHYVGHLKKI